MACIHTVKISLVFFVALFSISCGQNLSQGTSSDESSLSGVLPGSGSPDNPYLISSVEDWNYVGENPDLWSSDFKLQNDIDFSGREIKIWGAYAVNPQNSEETLMDLPFSGSLNGNGFALRNVYLDHRLGRDPNVKLGVFSYLSGIVTDLSILGAEVYSEGDETGILAGRVKGENALIENVEISGSVHSRRFIVGGMIGRIISGTVKSSSSSAEVTVEGTYAGGLIGTARGGPETNVKVIDSEASGNINRVSSSGEANLGQLRFGAFGGLIGSASKIHVKNSHATGDVSVNNIEFAASGGLIGHIFVLPENGFAASDALIEDSSASGNVVVATTVPNDLSPPAHLGLDNPYEENRRPLINGKRVGGLIGEVRGATIRRSFSSGDVSGGDQVGGLLGVRFYNPDVAPWPTFIVESYSESTVQGSSHVGELVGEAAENDLIIDSYAIGDVVGLGRTGGLIGTYSGSIQSSYAFNRVTYESDLTNGVGGLVGVGTPTVSNSAFRLEQDFGEGIAENTAGVPIDPASIQEQDGGLLGFFNDAGWNVSGSVNSQQGEPGGSIWVIRENDTRPMLRWQLPATSIATNATASP